MYKNKYLKYKTKYFNLKELLGGETKTFNCSSNNHLNIMNDIEGKNLDEKANKLKDNFIAIVKQDGLKNDNFCNNLNWSRDYNGNKNCNKWVPLKDICKKQFVIGRIENLTDYYNCENFTTLNHKDWTLSINDLFIYRAINNHNNVIKEENFPIRFSY
jgi:hypothetical protein